MKTKKELKEKLAELLAKMKGEQDPDAFNTLNDEFKSTQAELERVEIIEEAEKSAIAEATVTIKPVIEGVEIKGHASDTEGYNKAVKDFANAARKNFNEGTGSKGGYTVPEDIRTKIEKLRDEKFSLRQLVAVENVKTLSGERTYQNRATGAGFASVGEGGKIPKMVAPTFFRIAYKIAKYGGFMFATNELLDDSDANIVGVVTEWFAENARVTDNKIILATLDEKYTRATDPATAANIASLDDLKKIINVKLGQTFAPTSVVVTNDDGLQWLDTLKDDENHTLLKTDENNPLNQYLSIGFRRVPLKVIPNGDLPTDTTKGVPFYVGDLKEACRIYDRKSLSIMASDVAAIGQGDDAINAYEEDLTVWRGLERLDCQLIDEAAYVLGYLAATGSSSSSTAG